MRGGRVAAVVGSAALVLGAGAAAPAQARKAPARFHVGAAVSTIPPPVPVSPGGFGLSPPIAKLHDPLTARAFYVASRGHAVAFVTVDAQGYFAAYQESPTLGITDERETAAKRISAIPGATRMTRADIVGPATHGHQESPVEVTDAATMRWFARVVESYVEQGLGSARLVTDPTVAGAEAFAQVPASNAALLALNRAWSLPDAQKEQGAQA